MDRKPSRTLSASTTKVAGTTYLVMGRNVFELGTIEIEIWARLDGRHTVNEIAIEIAEAYDHPYSEVEADVTEFLADLHRAKLITY